MPSSPNTAGQGARAAAARLATSLPRSASASHGRGSASDPADALRRRLLRAASPGARASIKIVWVAVYGVTAVLPLGAVLAFSPPRGRGFVLELGSALGIVALALLALQLVLPARVRAVVRPLGADVALRLHRDLQVRLPTGPGTITRWPHVCST